MQSKVNISQRPCKTYVQICLHFATNCLIYALFIDTILWKVIWRHNKRSTSPSKAISIRYMTCHLHIVMHTKYDSFSISVFLFFYSMFVCPSIRAFEKQWWSQSNNRHVTSLNWFYLVFLRPGCKRRVTVHSHGNLKTQTEVKGLKQHENWIDGVTCYLIVWKDPQWIGRK